MLGLRTSEAGLNWRAAALLGLISSTFSTLMSQLISARIGRDAAVDWMVVAAIPLRDPILQSDPTWTGIRSFEAAAGAAQDGGRLGLASPIQHARDRFEHILVVDRKTTLARHSSPEKTANLGKTNSE